MNPLSGNHKDVRSSAHFYQRCKPDCGKYRQEDVYIKWYDQILSRQGFGEIVKKVAAAQMEKSICAVCGAAGYMTGGDYVSFFCAGGKCS